MITPGLSYGEYEKLPGFNSSVLKVVSGASLLHAKAYMDGKRKESDALSFGTSFHELLLRGKEDFIAHPETYPAPKDHAKVKSLDILPGSPLPWNANAGVCKKWMDENATGKRVCPQEEASQLRAMVNAARLHPDLAPHLSGQCEVAVTAEKNGLAIKALVDLLPDDPSAPVIDFKKCRSAKPDNFIKDAFKFGYHIQAALNIDALNWNGQRRTAFWLVAIEDCAPHAVWIAKLNDTPLSILRMGRRAYRSAADLLSKAIKSGNWPSYPDNEAEAYLPSWLIPELEQTA